ncbi:hypothetical protein [Citrobacter sp. TSA-1]|uniref:hypothetical protein n=1 Tax=Citrobacter sp. TSA-1 TaxID=184912 RepID=UPI000BAE1758|nr:hypothetical protein [Citrobacter sp. TSA-1]PAX78274.1 hypothetical protein CIK43_18960 [Citrobacter sp. TSA-1]QKE19490.1 hypothetical protein HF677_007320 [Citrobacter sp. TSA-1]
MTHPSWTASVLRPAAMDITCSMVCFHPWSENTGNITPSGRYLSPGNAISALLPYLTENTEKDVVALLLCAPSASEFLSLARQFSGAFPLPEVGRMSRMISSQISLAISRMQLPAKPATTLPSPVTLSTQITRQLSQAAAIAQAGKPAPLSLEALSSSLNQFKDARNKALQEIASLQGTLQQNTCPVWRFCYAGALNQTAVLMQKNIPHPEWVFTAVMLFVGDDLSSLRGALHDPDDCPCA